MEELHEKCAVAGVNTLSSSSAAAHLVYQSLFALQHRGVEGSGIVTNGDGEKLVEVRKPGLVRDVFNETEIASLQGNTATGHNRYSTNGGRESHLQPFINPHILFSLAHNGNIPDTAELESYLQGRNYKTNQYNDSELLGLTLSSQIHNGLSLEDAVLRTGELARGSYSCVAMYDDKLLAFRDPFGIRPLELGTLDGTMMVASETCALDTVGAMHLRSVEPGELIVMADGRIEESFQFAEPNPKLDIFELVYFARHDSKLYGRRVNEVRREFGRRLALSSQLPQDDLSNTIVSPVPDTSIPAAEGFAQALGLPHEQTILKNRYIDRTFMQPSQDIRRSNLRLKHTMIDERVKGRDVILIDDSIVRGNTMPRLVRLAQSIGAKSVSVIIASPPVRFPDFYGIDTPHQSELLAANLSVEQMREYIGADYLGFLSLGDMVEATGISYDKFNLASFNGEYPIDLGRHAQSIRAPRSTEYMD